MMYVYWQLFYPTILIADIGFNCNIKKVADGLAAIYLLNNYLQCKIFWSLWHKQLKFVSLFAIVEIYNSVD